MGHLYTARLAFEGPRFLPKQIDHESGLTLWAGPTKNVFSTDPLREPGGIRVFLPDIADNIVVVDVDVAVAVWLHHNATAASHFSFNLTAWFSAAMVLLHFPSGPPSLSKQPEWHDFYNFRQQLNIVMFLI